MSKTELVRIRMTPEYIRERLIAEAAKHYPARHLDGLDRVPTEPREVHKRHHTFYVSPEIAKKAKPGNPACCAFALTAVTHPGIFAAFVLQRVAYTLERDEQNKWAIYKFGTPDIARKRIVAFDRGRGMKPLSVTFNPLPPSRTAEGVRHGKGTGKKRGPRSSPVRKNTASLMRMSAPADLAA